MAETLLQTTRRWPDKDEGPLTLTVTIALVEGRPQPIGLEIWAVDPATLETWATGMTRKGAKQKWLTPTDSDAAPAAIRTKDLREIPLQRIVEERLDGARRAARILTSDRVSKAPGWASEPSVQRAAMTILEPQRIGRKGRLPHPRSQYEEVAAVYREARGDDRNPTQAVADHFQIAYSTAATWISRCRKDPLNLLGPTVRGRAAD